MAGSETVSAGCSALCSPSGSAVSASFSEAAKNFVDPWKVGDESFGWTSEGTAVTFLVQSVDATTLKATLTQKSMVEIAAGKTFHVVYSPGTAASAFGEKKLEMDLSAQDQNEMPLPLVATATATETGLAFRFACPFAVIGIKDPVFHRSLLPEIEDELECWD